MATSQESRRKEEATQKAIRDGGFYGNNGTWNAIITFPGDKTIYRHRVETIVVKNNKSVFLKKKFDGKYYLPGGSVEKDIPFMDQAINECREEAHFNVRNIEATGITYKEKHDPPNWAKHECAIEWNGTYTEIFVAEYDGKYTGKIEKQDEDPFIRSGEWYSTKECFKFFRKEHREALLWFLKNHQETKEGPVTESYISNYFANKRLLKKISHNPDIERGAIEQAINALKKEYSKLSAKSKIQRERKQDDVETIFHPVISFDFNDKSTITLVICFDDSSFTDGAAIHTSEYGDLVVVYPCFFKEKKEQQVFTLLHEFGHIRLNHLYTLNSPPKILASDNDTYRSKMMDKGKAMYPEINADLYAVLNGASMYSILGSSISQDSDDQYDYRFTNAELASRYNGVFNQYRKLKKFNESTDEPANLSVTKYDLACSTLYEMVYMNEDTDSFNSNEKDILYSIMYEVAINKYIKNEPYVKRAEKEYKESSDILKSKESIYQKYKNINEMSYSELSNDELEFKLEVESTYVDNIPQLENDLYALRCRYENAFDGLMYARSKAYNEYADTLEMASCMIGPAMLNNEKSVIISSEKQTLEDAIHEIANRMIDICDDESLNENTKDILTKYRYLIESLTSKERNSIPLEKFGIPETRSFPLDTKKHVYSAIRLFGHCDRDKMKELADNIFKAMEHYKIPKDVIGDKSKLRDYM